MRLALYRSQLMALGQRCNVLVIVDGILLLVVLLQSMVLVFSWNNERVVLVPPEIHKRVWVSSDKVSAGYLEEMSLFFTSLALNVTPKSAVFQQERLLRYVDPRAYGALKVKLMQEAETLSQRNLSTVFYPVKLETSTDTFTVKITGDLVTLLGQTQTANQRKVFVLKYLNQNGQLWIKEFQESHENV